jgi:hypothetical protein
MHFPRIGTKAKGRLDSCLSERQARRCAIPAIEVNVVVGPGQLAIRLEKGRVMRDSLVQQIGSFQQIRFPRTGRAHNGIQKKIFSAAIKIEGGEIGRWRALNGQSLGG